MKSVLFFVIVGGLILPSCQKADTGGEDDLQPAKIVPEGARANGHGSSAVDGGTSAASHGAPAQAQEISGEVIETVNAGRYTYAKVKTPTGEIWAAGPETTIAVGDAIRFSTAMPMHSFRSPGLNRTFDLIYFAPSLQAEVGAKPAVSPADAGTPAVAGDVKAGGDIKKVAGGKRVAEVVDARVALAGQKVSVRGKVVKFNSGIMGRNWIHIQDGSGNEGNADLLVTTDGSAEVGTIVSVTGTVAIDRDFGAGYKYEVIVENATLAK